jgi:putative ABC transport system permease protein
MQIKPVLSALRRHKAGTLLIALQIALTLAIVCNALFIIQQRVSHLSRPTGMVESDLFAVQMRWVGKHDNYVPMTRSDLALLRSIPGVEDAYATNSFPLRNGGWSMDVRANPEAKKGITQSTLYFVDDHALRTLGTHLIAGRNFLPGEVISQDPKSSVAQPQIIITQSLAKKVFPDGSALGKSVYITQEGKPSTVIGIVDKLQVPWVGNWANDFGEHSILIPAILNSDYVSYLVRTRPGQLDSVMKGVVGKLKQENRMRVLPDKVGLRTFGAVRRRAYESDRGMAIMMSIVCVVLLAITAAGIVGLTSFWVGQRRKQIGVRRALGATKNDILSYFLTENLLIGVAGVVVGAALAVGMNMWMMAQFEMARLSVVYVVVGVVALLLLGQGAVLAPAMRASRVSPVEATRSV